jgi:hypothetical protein
MKEEQAIIPVGRIEQSILRIRGQKVILDADLARLYGVTTKRLNEQVRRNPERFPSDFVFLLNSAEKGEVVAICDHLAKLKYLPALPYAFTEHGAIMAASVLKTPQAVKTSVFVVRAFVKLREMLAAHKELAHRLDDLERGLQKHDRQILSLVQAIRELMAPPEEPRRPIGFATELEGPKRRPAGRAPLARSRTTALRGDDRK